MSFDRIFKAESVAIIGAPKDETKRGYQDIKILLDEKFDGLIYPVNPDEKTIRGLKCYKSVLDIPGKIDLALITSPAHTLKHEAKELFRLQGVPYSRTAWQPTRMRQ